MEINEVAAEEKQALPVPPKRNQTNYLLASIMLVCMISLALSVYLLYQNHKLTMSVSAMESAMNEKIESTGKETKEFAEKSRRIILYNLLQQDMRRMASKDFVIDKFTFWGLVSTPHTTSTRIDVTLQPSINSKYTGLGKFDLSDQELKAMLEELLQLAESHYIDFTEKHLSDAPPWDKLVHTVAVNNYIMARYSDGEIKLIEDE